MSKNIEMQVLGANGEYEQIYPVPAGHASSHSKKGSDPINPTDIGAMDKNIYDSQNRNTDIFTYTDSLLQNKVNTADFQSHANSKSNPHGVTAAQTGAYPNGIKGAVNCNDLSDGAWTISGSATNGPGAFACTLFHKDWNADFASQFAFGADHNVYYRVKTGGSWLAWQEMYSTLRYPSPSKIGSVAKSGDTMTGALTISKSDYPDLNIKNTGSGSVTKIRNSAHRTQIMSQEDENNYRVLTLNDKTVTTDPGNILQIVQIEGGSQTASYKVYHTGNKPTLSDIGAAASSHNHSATNITSGTLAVARGGTGQTTVTPDVGTKGVRQIYAGTSDMTAGSTSLTTGVIYLVYE